MPRAAYNSWKGIKRTTTTTLDCIITDCSILQHSGSPSMHPPQYQGTVVASCQGNICILHSMACSWWEGSCITGGPLYQVIQSKWCECTWSPCMALKKRITITTMKRHVWRRHSCLASAGGTKAPGPPSECCSPGSMVLFLLVWQDSPTAITYYTMSVSWPSLVPFL